MYPIIVVMVVVFSYLIYRRMSKMLLIFCWLLRLFHSAFVSWRLVASCQKLWPPSYCRRSC